MVRVGLVQFNVDFQSEYLPYSVGLLQAYAQSFSEIQKNFNFMRPLYKRERDVAAVARSLAAADIAAFSIYVWNTQYSLEVARQVRALNPKCAIIFGGPNVPGNSEQFLRKYPWVDFTVFAEGEIAFKEFLLGYLANDFSNCPSLRFLDKRTGNFVMNPKAPRVGDLSEIPSPYLSGVFSELMAENPQQTWNVLWETNRGCPFSCTYCDWGSATQAKVNRFPLERLMQELEWFSKNKIEYLMAADANFGLLERDIEIAQKLAELKETAGYPMVFAGTFTKNATERSYKIAEILMGAELIRGYTVSTQTVDVEALKNIRRENISQETFTTLQARFNRDKLPTYTDLIIGLPGETYASFKKGVSTVIARGQFNKCYFLILSILPNAQMADPEYQRRFGFETVWAPQKNLHETVRDNLADITEFQELVIATNAMPKDDWRRAVCFGYVASLIYFNKLLHIPLTMISKSVNVPFEHFVDAFLLEGEDPELPFLSRINKFFREHAMSIQTGGLEYAQSEKWLNVWWQPDKIAFMEACTEIDQFYQEAEILLQRVVAKYQLTEVAGYLLDAIRLNKALVRSPFKERPSIVTLNSNIYDHYRKILEQGEIKLQSGTYHYKIDRHDEKWESVNEWCKRVVWYCNKTSDYLSTCTLDPDSDAGDPDVFNGALLKPYLYA